MPINSLIPMAGNRSRLPNIIELGTRRRDMLDQRNIQNERQARLDNIKIRAIDDARLKDQQLAEQNRVNEAIRSIAIYSEAELNPLLDDNDIPGAITSLTNRRQELLSIGKDTQDTDTAIKLLSEGKVDEVRRLSNTIVTEARMRELIPKAVKVEQTTAEKAAEAGAIAKAKSDATQSNDLARRRASNAGDRLNVPGEIVMATDLNPDLPDSFKDVVMVQQPNGTLKVLKGANGEGGSVDFFRVENDKGQVEVFMQEGNSMPKPVGLLESTSGETLKTQRAQKEENIGARTNTRENRLERQQDISEQRLFLSKQSLEQSITQQARTSESTLRKDFESRVKPYREQIRQLDVLDALLSGEPNGLKEAQIVNQMATLSDSNVRAQANLNTFKNPGDIGTRVAGAVTKFFSGTRTQSQLDEIKNLSRELRYTIFNPALDEVSSAYRDVANRSKLNPDNVVIQRSSAGKKAVIEMTTEELEAELSGG